MKSKVIESLVLARRFCHSAIHAGTKAQAVADGYSAIDACFSALLYARGLDPSENFRNHKKKLEWVEKNYPNIFDAQAEPVIRSYAITQVDWIEIHAYYRLWLDARYSQIHIGAYAVSDRVKQSDLIYGAVFSEVANLQKIPIAELSDRVELDAFGGSSHANSRAIAWEAEVSQRALEESLGLDGRSKLAAAALGVADLTRLAFTTDDKLTRDIIQEDDVARELATYTYTAFAKLIERVQFLRLEGDPETQTSTDQDHATDFLLSLNIRYHGGTMTELLDGLSTAVRSSRLHFMLGSKKS